ncbi:hypothetical protein MRS44_001149 [Fusarium solani]|uniref:uncharacterized protein n=1 Tax=Fusarium solani TaxID=169388 RepID=UPI0032C4775B|nr:hypothetical protein MRS44_001149 [Fusarium solani]
MDNAHSKEIHTSFPEFQYSNPENDAQMPDQEPNQPQSDKASHQTTPSTTGSGPYYPFPYEPRTQLARTLFSAVTWLRVLRSLCWVFEVDLDPWIGPLRHVVVLDSFIHLVLIAVWLMQLLVRKCEAGLAFFKPEAAARGDAGAKADFEALREKRDWNMLWKQRSFKLPCIFGASKGANEL